jgi:hypothetical protein
MTDRGDEIVAACAEANSVFPSNNFASPMVMGASQAVNAMRRFMALVRADTPELFGRRAGADRTHVVACFADHPPTRVKGFVPLAGKRYAELAWHCAKALGRGAPLSAGAKTSALRDFDTGAVVDQEHAARACALAKDLEEAGWFS